MFESRQERTGFLFALAAFVFWALSPIYYRAILQVPPQEILAHRVVWSVVLTAGLIAIRRGWRRLRLSIADRRVLATLLLSASLVAVNWFIFIYSVLSGRLVEASLGYFINPLVNVLLGMVFLRERLRPFAWLAVGLALAGTLNLTLQFGRLPWIALVLAFSFGFYGLLRKTVRIDSVGGLFVETMLASPVALVYLGWLASRGEGAFRPSEPWTALLLSAAGAVTTLPLIWYTSGARRLPYTTIGLIQYLAPSGQLVLAVVVFGEAFTPTHGITFALIWSGLVLFVVDSLILRRRRRRIPGIYFEDRDERGERRDVPPERR